MSPSAPQLAPGVRQLLGALRRRIRRYVWLEGLAATIAALGFSFWLALGADWLFEPSGAVRQGLLLAVLAVGASCLAWFVLRRALARLSDHSMAVLLERRFGTFEDSLLTAVELTARDEPLPEYGTDMLSRTCEEAWRRSSQVDLRQVFNRAPLLRWVSAAAVIVLSFVTVAVASPDLLRFGLDRLTAATDQPWPRRTKLHIEGFDNERREAVVARGMDVDIHVQAEATPPRVVPQVVEVRCRADDGRRERHTMVREGIAVPGQDEYQDYRFTLGSVLSSLSFDVVGGDARLRDLHIRVVESPSLSMHLQCEYPAYTGRLPADVPVTGVVPLPLGTRVKIMAQASKDLRQVEIDVPSDSADPVAKTIGLDGGREFEFTLDELDADQTLSFHLLDTDGVRNRGPVRLALSAVQDEPPQVNVQLEGIGPAITPQARLPLAGKVTDDYGVARVWAESSVDGTQPKPHELMAATGQPEIQVEAGLEVADLELKPGSKLIVGAKAADNRDLPGGRGPNVGQGERFLLEVVTPDQLLTLLETRELNLRQRFESILQEVTETRDSLAALETAESAEQAAEPENDKVPRRAGDAATGQIDNTAKGRGGDEATEETADASEAKSQRNLLRVERARQNGQKNSEETRGVANAFEAIRAELINNRVDTEELRIRLKDRIADPLHRIVETMFPEFDRRLETFHKASSAQGVAVSAEGAVEQVDAIIVEMQKVRDQMLELESFNEAVDLLREIISAQQQVTERTKQERRKKVRQLLDDDQEE
ncbi:MAG TPA: hypothetical protein VJ783_02740 [Pirellulales bacterium]|nr:hypothetical protein [Pirellulales bacterium]